MSNPLQTKLRLLFTAAEQDVSQSVLPDLLSFTFSDKETGEADELRLTLKDETGKWAAAWRPDNGEVIINGLGRTALRPFLCGQHERFGCATHF